MINSKPNSLLGAHMSIIGGFDKALYRGQSIGCTAVQIFTHSNRSWSTKDITDTQINQFQKAKKETGIYSILSHASYLINLCSQSKESQNKSLNMLMEEFIRCEKLKIKYLVLHPGSCKKDKGICYDEIIDSINSILKKTSSDVILLIENMAGQGSTIGATFKEVGNIVKNVELQKRIGVCFDTCHAWAAGYDFSTSEKYKKMWESFDEYIGIDKLKAIHLNNSKTPLDSHVDRHAGIDNGLIPIEAFRLLMNDKRFINIPKILETPKDKDLEKDIKNLKILRDLIKNTVIK